MEKGIKLKRTCDSSHSTKQGNIFFQKLYFPGVYYLIFSFIPCSSHQSNKTIFHFGYTCKQLYSSLLYMINKSSVRHYRLQLLNSTINETTTRRPIDHSINLFQNNINYKFDERFFVKNIDEYENQIKNEIFFQIIGEINKKYGEVCMVAGGFALSQLLKTKKFSEHVVNISRKAKCPIVTDKEKLNSIYNKAKDPHDIDVFILGKEGNKDKILNEIIGLMKTRFKDSENFGVFCSKKFGLINIVVRDRHYKSSLSIPEMMRNNMNHISTVFGSYDKYELDKKLFHVKCGGKLFTVNQEKKQWTYPVKVPFYDETGFVYYEDGWKDIFQNFECIPVFQFIVKNIHQTPSDVFSFFDIDCCKIGYFPGLKKVVSSIGFIRSIVTGLNYCDLDGDNAGTKHLSRICKYYNRTFIKTTLEPEPLLSYFHSFIDKKVDDYFDMINIKKLYKWGKSFGNPKDLNYYRMNPSDRKARLFYFRLSKFDYKIEIDENKENKDLPYMANSVAIVKNIDLNVYQYHRKSSFKQMIKDGRIKLVEYVSLI